MAPQSKSALAATLASLAALLLGGVCVIGGVFLLLVPAKFGWALLIGGALAVAAVFAVAVIGEERLRRDATHRRAAWVEPEGRV